jgi:hypothetical protein
MSEQQQKDKQATETALQQRKNILARLGSLGVNVPKPQTWKLAQLYMLHDVVAPIVRKGAKIEQQLAMLQRMDALQPPDVTRWPPADTKIADQAHIATRLAELAKITGRPMIDLLEQCRGIAREYRSLGIWGALRAVENMNGGTWDEAAQAFTPYQEDAKA